MVLLDTDALSLLMAGHAGVESRVTESDRIGITIISRIEVLQGRFASILKAATGAEVLRAQEWLSRNELYMSRLLVVPFDKQAGQTFDRLRQDKKLKKIGRADLLIASIVLAQRATLVTRNVRHFDRVHGLKVATV
jgi:tRNA(fMet)-specific endonuclease VapC